MAALLLGALLAAPMGAAQVTAILQGSGSAAPADIVPGTTGRLELTLKNVGTQSTYRMTATVVEVDAGITVSGTRALLGGLGPSGSTVVSPFSVSVPSTTPAGVYHVRITVDYAYPGGGDQVSLSIPVTVRATPALFVDRVTPDTLLPGAQEWTLRLANRGSGDFSNIQGFWSSAHVLPLGGSNTFYVAQLGAGNSTEVRMPVAVQSGAAGFHGVAFQLAYRDAGGASLAANQTVGVRISDGPGQVHVALQDVGPGSVTVAAVNVGTGAANAVVVRFVAGPHQMVLGSDSRVLGNLEAGAFLTAKFDVEGDDLSGAKVTVGYTDASGARVHNAYDLSGGRVGSARDLQVTVQDVSSDAVVLAVTNAGTSAVTGVQVRLSPLAGFRITNVDTVAVGNLLPGEFAEAEFEVAKSSGSFAGQVEVMYTDDAGDRRSTTQAVGRSVDEESASPWSAVMGGLVLVLAVAAIVVWRRRRKQQQAQAAKEAEAAWARLRRGATDEPAWSDGAAEAPTRERH